MQLTTLKVLIAVPQFLQLNAPSNEIKALKTQTALKTHEQTNLAREKIYTSPCRSKK